MTQVHVKSKYLKDLLLAFNANDRGTLVDSKLSISPGSGGYNFATYNGITNAMFDGSTSNRIKVNNLKGSGDYTFLICGYSTNLQQLQVLVSRGYNGIAGGGNFEIELYNKYSAPYNRITTLQTGTLNYQITNGYDDSAQSTLTSTGVFYTVCVSMTGVPTCSQDTYIGGMSDSNTLFQLVGGISLCVIWNCNLSLPTALELTKNPWQLFQDTPQEIYSPPPPSIPPVAPAVNPVQLLMDETGFSPVDQGITQIDDLRTASTSTSIVYKARPEYPSYPQTILAYLNIQQMSSDNLNVILAPNSNDGSLNNYLSISANYLKMQCSFSGTSGYVTSGDPFLFNTWGHVACSWDGATNVSNMLLYQGFGTLLQQCSIGASSNGIGSQVAGNWDYVIGMRVWDGTKCFVGRLGYIARWNRPLSYNELLQAQLKGPQTVPNGLILFHYNGSDKSKFQNKPTYGSGVRRIGGPPPQNLSGKKYIEILEHRIDNTPLLYLESTTAAVSLPIQSAKALYSSFLFLYSASHNNCTAQRTKTNSTVSNNGFISGGIGKYGKGIYSSGRGNSSYIRFDNTFNYNFQTGATFIWCGSLNDISSSGYDNVFGNFSTVADSNGRINLLGVNGTTDLYWETKDASGTVRGTNTFTAGYTAHVIIGVWDGVYFHFYADGNEIGTPISLPSIGARNDVWAIGPRTGGTEYAQTVFLCGVDTIAWTASKVKIISNNPWQLFASQEQTILQPRLLLDKPILSEGDFGAINTQQPGW